MSAGKIRNPTEQLDRLRGIHSITTSMRQLAHWRMCLGNTELYFYHARLAGVARPGEPALLRDDIAWSLKQRRQLYQWRPINEIKFLDYASFALELERMLSLGMEEVRQELLKQEDQTQ